MNEDEDERNHISPETIGLSQADKLDSLEIVWPCRVVQKVNPPPPIDRLTIITEPR
jgi:hypothetical protein